MSPLFDRDRRTASRRLSELRQRHEELLAELGSMAVEMHRDDAIRRDLLDQGAEEVRSVKAEIAELTEQLRGAEEDPPDPDGEGGSPGPDTNPSGDSGNAPSAEEDAGPTDDLDEGDEQPAGDADDGAEQASSEMAVTRPPVAEGWKGPVVATAAVLAVSAVILALLWSGVHSDAEREAAAGSGALIAPLVAAS
ncbi:MAG: hypothetical protein ACR2NA_04745 [Solirubrobacterales bacterium]